MADESWPSELPDKQFEPIKETPDPGKLRTEMQEGPAKVRPTVTAMKKMVEIELLFDGSELETFNGFWEDTLDNGTKKFDWESPIDDSTTEFRFVERPKFSMDKEDDKSGDRIWSGKAKMEVLPS